MHIQVATSLANRKLLTDIPNIFTLTEFYLKYDSYSLSVYTLMQHSVIDNRVNHLINVLSIQFRVCLSIIQKNGQQIRGTSKKEKFHRKKMSGKQNFIIRHQKNWKSYFSYLVFIARPLVSLFLSQYFDFSFSHFLSVPLPLSLSHPHSCKQKFCCYYFLFTFYYNFIHLTNNGNCIGLQTKQIFVVGFRFVCA